VQNGGAYGHRTTESGIGFTSGAARTARKPGEFTIPSAGPGKPGQNYFVECFRQDQPANCTPVGVDERHGRQVATAIYGTGRFRLHDELRPGRPRPISDERVAQLVRKTLLAFFWVCDDIGLVD
jgi:hypothetical protein